MIQVAALLIVAAVALCFPHALHAWTPGTHVVLGERILSSLHLLPPFCKTLA
ncbi:MAG: hypothetical protein V4503_03765 [Gemmatimonadota bacterium]